MVENFTNITTNHMNTNKEEWEIEFDELTLHTEQSFIQGESTQVNAEHLGDVKYKLLPKIKQFIKTQRTQAKEEERKRIEAEVRELPDGLMVGGQSVTNTGKMSVLQILNKTQ